MAVKTKKVTIARIPKRPPPKTAFKKGHPKYGGRKKGTPNKITTDLKQAIINALDRLGGEGYLERVGKRDIKAFTSLLGRCIPTRIVAEVTTPEDTAAKAREHLREMTKTITGGTEP